jgi:hypothetical protein
MQAIIRRFDRAPLEDKILRANPAQPSKGGASRSGPASAGPAGQPGTASTVGARPEQRNRNDRRGGKKRDHEPKSAFATELAKVL